MSLNNTIDSDSKKHCSFVASFFAAVMAVVEAVVKGKIGMMERNGDIDNSTG